MSINLADSCHYDQMKKEAVVCEEYEELKEGFSQEIDEILRRYNLEDLHESDMYLIVHKCLEEVQDRKLSNIEVIR